ncbi:Flp pilus assembly pilin Flp [Arthrobacter ulcerisalmonis]|nr:Flp family type IVb pilin [Arthrobacter ulcerisalmonis]MDQ0663511.1 Flp pilus assembly pilin Flp [Arthrobacter ulcerisalmonis]
MIELLSGLELHVRQRAVRLLADEVGATATEYGILMAFIVVIALAGVSLFGLALTGWYDELTAHLKVVLGIP